VPAHLFLWGQKLGREIQPAAAFDEPCSALIVHLAWRTRMARRCGGRGRIRGARAGEPTCTLAVPAAPVGEKGSEGYAVARTIKSVRAFVPAMFVRRPGQLALAPPLCARFLACNALYLAWLGHAVLVRSWEEDECRDVSPA